MRNVSGRIIELEKKIDLLTDRIAVQASVLIHIVEGVSLLVADQRTPPSEPIEPSEQWPIEEEAVANYRCICSTLDASDAQARCPAHPVKP